MKGEAGKKARLNLLAFCHDGTLPKPVRPKVADHPSAAGDVRAAIIEGLNKLTPEHRRTFNRMYSPHDLERTPEATVACLPNAKLDWALSQVDASLENLTLT